MNWFFLFTVLNIRSCIMYQTFEKAKHEIEWLQFGYSELKDGNMWFSHWEYEIVCSNRLQFLKKVWLEDKKSFSFKGEHSDNIFLLNSLTDEHSLIKSHSSIQYAFDGLITSLQGVSIFFTFADCIPLILYDSKKKVMWYCHLGRKPITLGLTTKVLDTMIKLYDCDIENMRCLMGPSIFAESYHFPQAAQKTMPWREQFVIPVGDEWWLDLRWYVLSELESYWIQKHQIYVEKRDTCTDLSLFSHYRASTLKQWEDGRFIFYAMMS